MKWVIVNDSRQVGGVEKRDVVRKWRRKAVGC